MSQDIKELEEIRRLMYEASSPHLSRNVYYALENFEISGCQIAYIAISDTIAEIIKCRKIIGNGRINQKFPSQFLI